MGNATTSKLARTFQYVGAGLAAWQLKRGKTDAARQKAARHLQERLGRMRGLPQKVGQILSMSEDEDKAEAFTPLQDSAPPLPLEDLVGLMEDSWERAPEDVCESIDETGLAASLGQVHCAVLKDGRTVAVKVRYPGIEDAIDRDLEAIGWVAAPVDSLSKGFDLGEYRSVLRQGLKEELDYELEAHNQALLARAVDGLGIIVPDVVEELSDSRVLTTIWEDGETFESAKGWSDDQRSALAAKLVEQFLTLAIDRGVVHADPHPGNYRFRQTANGPEVVLYDYGCVYRLSNDERFGLLRLIHEAAEGGEGMDPFPLFVRLGFDADLLRPLRAKLPALCRVLFEPFASQGKYDIATWNKADRIADILGDDRMNFRIAGPANLLFLLRAYQGLLFYVRELGQPVFWARPLRALVQKHAASMDALELPEPADPSATYGCLAKNLNIMVLEDGQQKARITLPAGTVERLDDLLDDNIRSKIDERSIDVDAIVRHVRANQYAPQPLFDLEDGPKRFMIWLD